MHDANRLLSLELRCIAPELSVSFLQLSSVEISRQKEFAIFSNRISTASNIFKHIIICKSSTSPVKIIAMIVDFFGYLNHFRPNSRWLVISKFIQIFKNSLICLSHPFCVLSHSKISTRELVIPTSNNTNWILKIFLEPNNSPQSKNYIHRSLSHEPICIWNILLGIGTTVVGNYPVGIRYAGRSTISESEPVNEAPDRGGSVRQGDATMCQSGKQGNKPHGQDLDLSNCLVCGSTVSGVSETNQGYKIQPCGHTASFVTAADLLEAERA